MPDQREIGAIQAASSVPSFARRDRPCVQGQAQLSGQARLAGLKQGLEGSTVAIAAVLDGNWTSEDARRWRANGLS